MGRFDSKSPLVLVHDLKPSTTSVSVEGVMIEKCPVSGCWFMLKDNSGVIKVDTKSAGFVVAEIPLNTVIRASGKLSTVSDRSVTASGIRY